MHKITALLNRFWAISVAALISIFGVVQWQKPAWLQAILLYLSQLFSLIKAEPLKSLGALLLTSLLVIGGWQGYQAWKTRPQPVAIDFTVIAPTRTELENKAKPNPLTINFSASVAPLAMVAKDVAEGIDFSVTIEGRWHWQDDKKLIFYPAKDWPIDKEVNVKFSKKLVAEQSKLARWAFDFNTPAFTSTLEKAEFYQDPLDPALKKAIFQIKFSHPVDTGSVEQSIKLILQNQSPNESEQKSAPIPFTVTVDALKLNAFVHSKSLVIPRENQQILFTLDEGVTADHADAKTHSLLTGQVDIPGLYNSLTIKEVQLTVAANSATQQQEQILIISTSLPVHEQDIAKALRVWLLPRDNPALAEANLDQPYYWSIEHATPAILRQSTLLELQALPAEREFSDTHTFKIQADVARHLLIKIDKNLQAFGGYLLPNAFYQTVIVPEFPKELHIMGEGALLTLSGEKKLALMTRDLVGVNVELGRVLPEQLQNLVSQSAGDFSHPNFSGNFGQDNLSERFELKVPIPGLAHGQTHYQAVDLSHYLLNAEGQNKRGIFLLTVKNYDPEKEKSTDDPSFGEVVDNRLILVTDLGIIAKTEQDGSQVVFVQSIQSGQAQADAEVSVIGKNGLVLFSGKTDVDGKIRFAQLSGLEHEREPLMYLVRYQGDMSFLPLGREDRKLDFSRFNIEGAENALDANQLNAYLFSDRGIYRPGDTLNIGIIVKTEQWNNSLTGMPLEAEVLDARGLVVKRSKIQLNAGGFNELTYQTLENSATGQYTINLYTVKDGKAEQHLGSTSVKVEEFQPDRMKARLSFSKPTTEGWVHPSDLQAVVSVQNLYGTPAEARQVEASLTLKPALPVFKRYPDYHFFDPHVAKDGVDETLNPTQTDSTGTAIFTLDLDKYAQASYQLTMVARAFEAEGGRSVATEAQTLVSDLPFLIGYKADGNLDFVARNALRQVHFLAIDPQLKPLAADNLSLEFLERKVVSVLTRQEDNTYKYESRPKEISLQKTPLVLADTGNNVSLDSSQPGNFSYVLRNAEGLILSRVDFSVAGQGNVSRSLDRSAELQLTLDKQEYAPGEKIAINIRAPYTGAGLITIERDKVYKSVWFKADTQASVQSIEVPAELAGNGYVTVQYIREPGSDEIFMSPLSYGVVPFKVSLAQHTEDLKLSVPELIKPGQSLKIHLHSPEPTRAVVFAVDEGILQVARYQNPDPLGYFFKKRQLAVDTTQIVDLILPEFKKLMQAAVPGGDNDEDAKPSYLNPFKRKHDKPAVYWSGIVDVNGDKEFNYTVPETFNGTLRVIALAVNDARMASVTQSTQVRGDLIISPNAPFMIAPGDEFNVSAGIANNIKGSGATASVQVNLAVPASFEVIGEAKRTLSIAEGHEASVAFQLKTKTGKAAVLGNATLTFTAESASVKTSMRSEISLRPASPKQASLRFGNFKGKQEISIERQLFPELRNVSAGMSPLPLISIPGLTSYLDNFEHSCTEQLISKAIPILVLGKHPEFAQFAKNVDVETELLRLLAVLRTRQNAEGGFGLWTASPVAHEFASVYAAHFLLEALASGLPIPDDLLRNSLKYLQNLASSPSSELDGLRNRAHAAYLLTRQGIVTTAILSTLRESLRVNVEDKIWRNDLTAAYLSVSYQLLKQESMANDLLKTLTKSLGQSYTDYRFEAYYDPLIRDAQLIYLLARHFPQRLQNMPPTIFQGIAQSLQNNRYNTLSSAYLLLAYHAYIENVPPQAVEQMSLSLIDQAGNKQALALPSSLVPKVSLPDITRKLLFEGKANFLYYYAVSETGFDVEPPKVALKQGLEISRIYRNAQGEPVSQVALGEEITVLLRLRSIDRDFISNMAIQELLPGGFEVVMQPTKVDAETTGGSSDLVSAAEDQTNDSEPESAADSEPEPVTLPEWHDRIETGGNWVTDYTDVREDRVILYGTVSRDLAEYQFKIRATSAGNFTVPASFAEAMYEPTVQAHTVAGQIKVLDEHAVKAPVAQGSAQP